MYLNLSEGKLKELNSYWTAKEICQQPAAWRSVNDIVISQRTEVDAFIEKVVKQKNARVILTGAGTSAFIGDALAPHIRNKCGIRVDAISTTDIVASPDYYLEQETPTLLVSFARSGDSPESVASVELADKLVSNIHHLVITCNPDGKLSEYCRQPSSNRYCLQMPLETNDQSLAMTSSYSSMLVACLCVFTPMPESLSLAANAVEKLLVEQVDSIKQLAYKPFNRMVTLGSGSLFGFSKEASLKMLELTSGFVSPMCDTPLGFRHGPKSVVNEKSLIIQMMSDRKYASLYDSDLQTELVKDSKSMELVTLSVSDFVDQTQYTAESKADDVWLGVIYVVYCQVLAFYKALSLDISADNPSPTGEINRVVKGVVIHPFKL